MSEFIKTRLKFFFLSFFSDKTAKQAPKSGFFWVILALALSFLLILLGYYGSGVAPFSSHYDGAGLYTEFIDNAFESGGIELDIRNKKATAQRYVNTYDNEDDEKAFSINGYSLIVDTRPSDTPIVFTQVAEKDGTYISYEEYRALSDDAKKNYKVETRYTDKPVEVSPEDVQRYKAFLSAEQSTQKELESLSEDAPDYTQRLYALYVKNYYTSVGSILRGASVPVLRDYYYRNYITGGNAYYFYVFDDMCAGSFETDGGIPAVFGGYFSKCADGRVTDIHALVKKIYYDTAGQTFSSYFLGMVMQLPALVFIPIVLGLLMWGIGKLVKDGWTETFGGCYKTVNSFVWVSALLTALTVFTGGWLTAARAMYMFIPVLFGGILLVRTVVFCTVSAVKNRMSLAACEQKNNKDIFGGSL